MNARAVFLGIMLFPPMLTGVVAAQSAKHAVAARSQAGDEDARRQLAADLAEFQNAPDDAVLRNRIIALAKTMNPAPEASEMARTNLSKGSALARVSATPDDFKAAARLFEQAAVRAPWLAEAYMSAASAYAKAADYEDARRNLALYRAAARAGVDTFGAEQLMRDLDRQEAAQFQQELRQFAANPTDTARRQIIKMAMALKPAPEIPEEARGHYVMAVVLTNSSDDNPGYEQRAITEFKAALLAAPWWADAYHKLSAAQKSAGQYEDALASLNFYLLTQPTDARAAQDEIYRLMVLEQRAADDEAKKQTDEQRRKLLDTQQQNQSAAMESGRYTIEGRWYQVSTPNSYFTGGKLNPECDYIIQQSGGRWSIRNSCTRSPWSIDRIEVQTGQISFRLSGHDPGYPFVEARVTFSLSGDGQSLEGQESVYNSINEPLGAHSVRWLRRQ